MVSDKVRIMVSVVSVIVRVRLGLLLVLNIEVYG